MEIKVTEFSMKARNGRHIRMATRVIFPDGCHISFMDKLGKKEAIRQAVIHRGMGCGYFVATDAEGRTVRIPEGK